MEPTWWGNCGFLRKLHTKKKKKEEEGSFEQNYVPVICSDLLSERPLGCGIALAMGEEET